MLHFAVLCGKTVKIGAKPHPAILAGWGFVEGVDCYVRSGMPAEEETPPVCGFSAPERHLTGKQRPPDFFSFEKRHGRSDHIPPANRRRGRRAQSAPSAQRRPKACRRCIPDRRCSERPYGAAHRRPPGSGSDFPGDSRYSPFLPGRQQHCGNRSGTREARRALIPGAGQTAGTGGTKIAAGGEGLSHGGAPPFYDVSEYHKNQCTAGSLPL